MDTNKIDSYLFGEMSQTEREKLEDRFVADDDLFAEIADRENELVDAFIRNELSAETRIRFEKSFEANPARREKISNAKLIREFIDTEREPKTITIAERRGIFAKFADAFTFRSPVLQFASVVLIILLGLVSVFLLRENRRLGVLEAELAAARQRETELAAQVDNAQDVTGSLTEDLDASRKQVSDLEAEIANLKKNPDSPRDEVKPTIATIVLSPPLVRGPGPRIIERVEIPPGVERISALLVVDDATDGALVSVKLNGETIARNVRVRSRPSGEKRISVTIPRSKIANAQNELSVFDSNNKQLGDGFLFTISERK